MPKYNINYGDAQIDGGLFLKRKSVVSSSLEYKDGEGDQFKHLSTFSGRSTIKESIIAALKNAKRYVFFTSFLIQDEQIIESLIDCVKRLKGHVYVLTTLKDRDFDELAVMKGEGDFDQWNFKEHMEGIKELVRNGISVKARKDCHAKFVVIDDKYAIITSANSVPTCFADIPQKNGFVREANPENGVLIEMHLEVLRLSNFFRYIWRSAYNYYMSPDSQVLDICEFSKNIIPIACREPAIVPGKDQVIWTAPNDYRILESLVKMIDMAEHSVCISSWVIKGIKGHLLAQKLVQATERGVEIEILLRGMYRSDHLESCYFLKQSLGKQIKILGDFCNHSKAALVDNKQAMLMSANIDSQHGLNSSVEVGFLSTNPDFVESVSNYLNRLRAGCVLEFIANPTQNHAAQNHATLYKPVIKDDFMLNVEQKWKGRDQKVNKLLTEMKSQLIRVSSPRGKNGQEMSLYTNNMIIDCVRQDAKSLNVLRINETPRAASLHFRHILSKVKIKINVS
ncbi:MAG: phosphatidylserine/phosphatidylglycerophosphate/cardiolipin synthase family protein [Phycisphaerae bacterium]|nr:phosphatidylserine/phosphatidylglycerophosphate/cardiolipin synthase family protein [Phycisphaerae bacterium]